MIKYHPVAFKFFWDKWEKDTCYKSYHDRNHFAYQALAEMGEEIIPHLLLRLDEGWLAALLLGEIVDVCPIKSEHAGQFRKINDDWRDWAKKNGYAWVLIF